MAETFSSVSVYLPALNSGDEQAWTEVCSRFQIGLISKARQLVNGSSVVRKNLHAEDLVQETLLKVWKARDRFQCESTAQLAKWMLTILKNTFIDCCRKKNIEFPIETWQEVYSEVGTPSGILSQGEREAELLAALDELNSNQQTVIAMRFFEGLSFPEIAKRTQQNVNTVGGLYRRGLIRITSILRKSQDTYQY